MKPERMLPHHLTDAQEPQETQQLSPSEAYKERHERLEDAPDLDPSIRLLAVEQFQQIVREAQDLRVLAKESKSTADKTRALKLYSQKKKEIDAWLADEEAPSFEKSYREYIRGKLDFYNFKRTLSELSSLDSKLGQASFEYSDESSTKDGEKTKSSQLTNKRKARLERIGQTTSLSSQNAERDLEVTLESLRFVYAEDSPEYLAAKEELLQENDIRDNVTKREIQDRIVKLRKDAEEMWEDPMVRYFWNQQNIDQLLEQAAAGQDVWQTQSVIHYENKLHEWEQLHQRTTIGGVLVGPPGVGKTTLVRDYLEAKDRGYVYMDLSEDVTRYLLFGSKSLEFKDSADAYKHLAESLQGLSDSEFEKFVRENGQRLQDTFKLTEDEAVVATIGQLEEALQAEGIKDDAVRVSLSKVKERVMDVAQRGFRKELGNKFAHIVKRNGWRDGVAIAALRRGDSLLFDEFNKFKNWSLIYGLLTAKPGERWYFADNDEYIDIPENWRMYFTANIDRKHGVFEVAEALASRAQAQVMSVEYPPKPEEMTASLITLSNPEGDFLRSKEDLGKLFILIQEVFPKIRGYIEGKRQTIPISFRTIRDLGEKLIMQRDPKNKQPIYQPTSTSFDEGVYNVLIESYGLYENKEVPKEIVNFLTSAGILLDDPKLKTKVEAYIGEQAYAERKEASAANKKDFEEIIKEIRGIQSFGTTTMPLNRSF